MNGATIENHHSFRVQVKTRLVQQVRKELFEEALETIKAHDQEITDRRYWDPTTFKNYYSFHPQDTIGVRFARTAEEQ